MEEAFYGDKYISHFYCPDSHFNFTFPCRSKSEFNFTFRTVLRIIKKQWNYDVRAFRLDGETSLIRDYQSLTAEHGVTCQVSDN